MQKCIAKAQSTLPRFVEGLKQGQQEAFVKCPVNTKNNNVEHVWGLAHAINEDVILVSDINETVELLKEQNPRHKVPIDNIEDWMLTNTEGNCEGGYTHFALYEAYKKEYGKFPKKYLPLLDTFIDIDFKNGTFK